MPKEFQTPTEAFQWARIKDLEQALRETLWQVEHDPPLLPQAKAIAQAALSATTPTSEGEGIASESRSGTAIAGEAKGHSTKDSQVATDAPLPSGGTPCPWCGKELVLHFDVCRYCGRDPLKGPRKDADDGV